MSRTSSADADSPSSNPDSFIWHETFIPENFVNAPDPNGCLDDSDWWFKGDFRDFTQYADSGSTRSKVRLRMDWSARKLYYTRSIATVERYYRTCSGIWIKDSQKKGVWENFAIHYVNRDGPCDTRCRLHIRHGAQNPYEFFYGAIDYEWEYVVTKDGGVTARGMHDGAPNYQTFYQPRGSSGVGIGYTFTRTNYESLAAPMDWRDRTWCLYGCPTWGTSYWV